MRPVLPLPSDSHGQPRGEGAAEPVGLGRCCLSKLEINSWESSRF